MNSLPNLEVERSDGPTKGALNSTYKEQSSKNKSKTFGHRSISFFLSASITSSRTTPLVFA
jgi:hypothetical protein